MGKKPTTELALILPESAMPHQRKIALPTEGDIIIDTVNAQLKSKKVVKIDGKHSEAGDTRDTVTVSKGAFFHSISAL